MNTAPSHAVDDSTPAASSPTAGAPASSANLVTKRKRTSAAAK
ncbi:Protein of unknown function [Pyronema omphalodes CBS 100304]|uniref:Uncharacterized protein n=1 Tax=Pyronema omphalodes (strain CBS 100304) TaxID=1076935 RepID=U4KWN1_PYROM|nr:Protein of unknown function [Pyronema omphalodes CBS 100304]